MPPTVPQRAPAGGAPRPLILLTNDDGYTSPGLRALWQELDARYETLVVAPARQRSWVGKALSNPGPLTLEERQVEGKAFWVVNDGTPADCVNLALYHLVPREPDLVIAGINLGSNFTTSLALASGTIGAALEAALHGILGLAANLALDEASERALQGTWDDSLVARFQPAARAVARFLETERDALPRCARLVNLIVPDPVVEPPRFRACAPLAYDYGSVFVRRADGYYNRSLGFIASEAQVVEGSDAWAVGQGWCAYTCYTGNLERAVADA